MRICSSVLGIVVLILVLSFALSNRQDVTVAMWPFNESLQSPLYAIGLVPLAFGFFLGSFWGWISILAYRLRERRLTKELASLKGKLIQQQPAKKPSFWSRS
jgi:uncharacterized integral membrane protein